MDKLDVFMFILGFFAYLAIMSDLKNYDRKLSQYEALQKKKQRYVEKMAEKRAMTAMTERMEHEKAKQVEGRNSLISSQSKLM